MMNFALNASNLRVEIVEREEDPRFGLPKFWCVEVHVTGVTVNRPYLYGWSVGDDLKLADRLKAAILAGKVFGPASIKVDVNGKTYVSTSSTAVLGRRMNADLKRLGF